jgi:hypothetical protein
MSSPTFEIIALSVTGSLFLLYNIFVVTFSRGAFSRSLHSLVLASSAAFIQKHLDSADTNSDLLAVQSLRNTVLVAIFIGGIAFQAFESAATAAAGAPTPTAAARSLILASFLCLSFLNFALVIRAASHLAYMIGAAPPAAAAAAAAVAAGGAADVEEGGGAAPVAQTAAFAAHFDVLCLSLMNALSLHFSLGFRCLYASVPFTYASSGPTALCVSGACMLCFLVYSDFGTHVDARGYGRGGTVRRGT